MKSTKLNIEGVVVFEPVLHEDSRGNFHEWFKLNDIDNESNFKFDLKQANCSTSKKGTVRGIHFAKYPPGQQKYVKCFFGKILDVVVDLRINSKTFGYWEAIELSAENRKSIFIPNGIGHAFLALENDSTVAYLCDQPFKSDNEFGINPFDQEINIRWPTEFTFLISEKDSTAKSFKESFETLKSFEFD